MQVIIIGSNAVSASMAMTLSQQNFDVTIVGENEEQIKNIASKSDISTVCGRASYPDVLRAAGAETADVLLAISENDEMNMVACQVAYSLFNVPKKIARIRSQHYFIRNELFGDHNLPIDVFINPEKIIARYLSDLLDTPHAVDVSTFMSGSFRAISIRIEADSPLCGLTLQREVCSFSDVPLIPLLLKRKGAVSLIYEAISIEESDIITLGVNHHHLDVLSAFLDENYQYPRRLMIGGGGHVAASFARKMAGKRQVKLIEKDKARLTCLSRELPEVTVLDGDIADKDLVLSENIHDVELFCALTNDDEANILSSLQAKHLGAKRVMSLINRTSYTDILKSDADTLVLHPQAHTVSAVLSAILKDDVIKIDKMVSEGIQWFELRVNKSSACCGKSIHRIESHQHIRVAAIGRANRIMMPNADMVIEPNDVLVLVTQHSTQDLLDIIHHHNR